MLHRQGTPMTKRFLTAVICLFLTLAMPGCDGGTSGSAGTPGGGDNGRVGDDPAVNDPGTGGEGDVDTAALLGRWEAISQDGVVIRDGELIFTFSADGTGMSIEGSSEKPFTWTYDPVGDTLHVVAGHEDLHFDTAMAGNTLSLVMTLEEGEMSLLLRRLEDDAE